MMAEQEPVAPVPLIRINDIGYEQPVKTVQPNNMYISSINRNSSSIPSSSNTKISPIKMISSRCMRPLKKFRMDGVLPDFLKSDTDPDLSSDSLGMGMVSSGEDISLSLVMFLGSSIPESDSEWKYLLFGCGRLLYGISNPP